MATTARLAPLVKSFELPPLTDDAIDAPIEHASPKISPKSYCIVFQLGGALAGLGEGETSFSADGTMPALL